MRRVLQDFKWKKAVLIAGILCTALLLFLNFREIRIKKQLADSISVSVFFRETSVYDVSLTDDFRMEEGDAEFESLIECLGRHRYYKKIFPRNGFKEKTEEIDLTFWNRELSVTTWFAVYSDGTVYVNGEEVRCMSGWNSREELYSELYSLLNRAP